MICTKKGKNGLLEECVFYAVEKQLDATRAIWNLILKNSQNDKSDAIGDMLLQFLMLMQSYR